MLLVNKTQTQQQKGEGKGEIRLTTSICYKRKEKGGQTKYKKVPALIAYKGFCHVIKIHKRNEG